MPAMRVERRRAPNVPPGAMESDTVGHHMMGESGGGLRRERRGE